jgi:hypothetical protein
LVAPTSHAGGASEAEQLFREGRRLVQAGDYPAACPKFAESERIEPAPGTLLNLADCEEHARQLVSAREHFGLAASGFPRGDSRRDVAMQRAAALEARLAHLTLRLAETAPAGTVVRKGGVVVDGATLGQPQPADPGDVKIVVSAAGHVDQVYPLTLGEGAHTEVSLDVGDVSTGNPSSTGAKHAPIPIKTIGIVLLGVGGAGLATGAVTGLLALTKAHIVKDHCDATYHCDAEGVSAASSGETFATVSTVTLIAGGVLAAAGGSLLLLGRKNKSHRVGAAAVVPLVGPGVGGVGVSGAF